MAVRIFPCVPDETPYVQSIPITPTYSPTHGISSIASGIVQVGAHSFPVTHSLPVNCSQTQVYHQTVYPLVSLFLEGFDASVVTYGQKGTGKSYTLFGPGFDCIFSETEQGIVQRCVREIFAQLAGHRERNFAMNIGWVEINGEAVTDLLGAGSVHCTNVTDVFHWLQVGMTNRSSENTHNLFTITLEQQWVSQDGLIQHRLSTASFCDLCGTERMFVMNSMEQHVSVPKDLGLQCLERIVTALTDPSLAYNTTNNIQYNQTTLTTLLKDSFGGRAQTLLILSISPLERDVNETIYNLQFAFKAQCVRNYVIMNTFSDNNTPISPEVVPPEIGNEHADNFGLQFAASQWFKLVSNAEGLLSKLLSTKTLSEPEREQIEEWLFLKQECEECLSSSEVNFRNQKQLGPIQEAEEPEETASDDPETSCQQNDTDNESDSESQRPDLEEKIENLMEELRLKTDTLVRDKYQEYIKTQPKAVMDSNESFRPDEKRTSSSLGGRRRSIQPGASLSSAEIAMLNRVASREQMHAKTQDDFLETAAEISHPIRVQNLPSENVQKKLRKINTDIDAKQRQMKELENTIALKQSLISDLVKNNDTRTTAKQRFNKKKTKLEAEFEKTKKQLSKAVVNGRDKAEIERLKALTTQIEQRLQVLASIKHIAGESGQKVKKLHQSLQESKKQLEGLQKNLKKEKKVREQLEAELKVLKEKENAKIPDDDKGKNLKLVQARISHLDHVLKEKSDNLEQFQDGKEKESLRHEIRNLRRTRDLLLEQRCSLDRKLKKEKILSHREERKLLECDEAIEAIDAAIEFKNEMICGHKSIDTSDRLKREKGEQMLMERLNNLSPEEMRTLLYKYFTKVIDLRDSSRKLEIQLMSLERERDAWEWRERQLSNAVRQARLEGEHNAVLLQRQHETKLTLMLRHLAEETSASSSFNDRLIHPQLACANVLSHHTSPTSPQFPDSDFDLDLYKANLNKQLVKSKHPEMEICPMPEGLSKYKPLDKIKDKDRESKNKLFAKFQVLTRYHSSGNTSSHAVSSDKKKSGQRDLMIPEQNLKQLQLTTPPSTKVTRQKNKIIIQDSSRKN